MDNIRIFSAKSLRLPGLKDALEAEGLHWDNACHIGATGNLVGGLQFNEVVDTEVSKTKKLDLRAVPIAILIDMVREFSCVPRASVGEDDSREFTKQIEFWNRDIQSRRFSRNVQLINSFDKFLREIRNDENKYSATALWHGRESFLHDMGQLIDAGVRPDDLKISESDPSHQIALAKAIWLHLEHQYDYLNSARELFWPEGIIPKSTLVRLSDAMLACFGPLKGTNEVREVILHGFYFYTPIQWAFFKILSAHPKFRLNFIIHDDGKSTVFESWRHYFNLRQDMPKPQVLQVQSSISESGQLFQSALSGRFVELSTQITIQKFVDVGAFLRAEDVESVLAIEGPPKADLFAADIKGIRRLTKNMTLSRAETDVDLSRLPAGIYLLRLHDAVRPAPPNNGEGEQVQYVFHPELILDCFSSGYLKVDGQDARKWYSSLKRSISYFEDCQDVQEWNSRAEQLVDLVQNVVPTFDPVPTEPCMTERFRQQVSNPLRMVPWLDISLDDAQGIQSGIRVLSQAVRNLFSAEQVSLKDHLVRLKLLLSEALQQVSIEERKQIESMIETLGSTDHLTLGITAVLDLIKGLLSKPDQRDDDDARDIALGDPKERIKPLRYLDKYILKPASQPIHLFGMSDIGFPKRVEPLQWPFGFDDFKKVFPKGLQLLQLRRETSTLSDLYLLWLALDASSTEAQLRMSWIEDWQGQIQGPSPFLALLMNYVKLDVAIRSIIGGIDVTQPSDEMTIEPRFAPVPIDQEGIRTAEDCGAAQDALPSGVRATIHICQRRFMMQWIVGSSPSFIATHHLSMLYGNIRSCLVRLSRGKSEFAESICDRTFTHLTSSQRESSWTKSVVCDQSFEGGPNPSWILTLGGSRSGTRAIDKAYQFSMPNAPDELIPELEYSDDLLPKGVSDPDICTNCPLKDRCADAKFK